MVNAENCAVSAATPWESFGMTVELVEPCSQAGSMS
jgi:hypothetical protein